jgi:hypothetical protein
MYMHGRSCSSWAVGEACETSKHSDSSQTLVANTARLRRRLRANNKSEEGGRGSLAVRSAANPEVVPGLRSPMALREPLTGRR